MNAPLIRTFGLFWRADNVFWGRQKRAGAMLGSLKSEKMQTDFRPQVGVYALYADYHLVYVGQAGNGEAELYDRLKHHRGGPLANRWNQFSWFGMKYVKKTGGLSKGPMSRAISTSMALNHLEAVLVSVAEPTLNRQGGRWGSGAQQYYQVRSPELGDSNDEILRKLNAQTL